MQIGKWFFRDGGYPEPGVCRECGSHWPAYVSAEAYRNRQRAEAKHPGKECMVNPTKSDNEE